MSDEVAVNITFDDEDAAFIEILQKAGAEPLFLGEYNPDYMGSTDMKSLTWAAVSPLADFEIEVGFAVHEQRITALYLDLREVTDDIYEGVLTALPKLTYVKELILGLSEVHDMIPIEHLTHLQYLEITKEREVLLPPVLTTMQDLSVVVFNAKVDDIPNFGSNLNLQRLILKRTSVTSFPESIFNLTKMVWLEFGNLFERLPNGILNLKNLVVLDLVSDNLEYLPDQLGELSKLQHLSLETDRIDTLPSSFNQFQLMTDLYLWNFPFIELPKIICELTSLRYLWLKENSKLRGALEKIPSAIGKLTNLVDLQMNGHEIKKLPSTIGKLSKLETLNVGINSIKKLPVSLTKLKKLKRLELYLNPIETLPDNIGDLRSLENLDISDTKITEIPESIARIRNMKDFDALGCDLANLPESISGWNFTKFRSFLISLHDKPDMLPERVQEWLEKLIRYSNENEEKGIEVEISLYVTEEQDKYE